MNKNPYSVLGVSESATDEEIKKAYRELVKKYHPDKYADSDLADLAKEKMQEVNAAYDQIQNMRKNGSSSSGTGSYGTSGSGTSSQFAAIRQLINARRFSEAMSRLNAVSASDRNAEWNFLMGCTMAGAGRIFDARSYIERACAMDPENDEYRMAMNQLSNISFGNSYGRTSTSTQCSGCDMCQSLLCADCCCECMGGDLIRCC